MAKKKKETMIIIGLLVFAAILFLGSLLISKKKEDKIKEESKTISLMKVDSSLVDKIELKNSNGDVVFGKDGEQWVAEDDKEFPVNQEMVNEMITYLTDITAVRSVSDGKENAAEYGLENPCATGTLTLSDGTTVKVFLGDTLPDSNGDYGMVENVDGIYVFEAGELSALTLGKEDFKGEEPVESEEPVSSEAVETEVPEESAAN